jgi:hypothetical protein
MITTKGLYTPIMAQSREFETTGKTPNGSDWPMNYGQHTQAQMDYAWRSPGSWVPDNVASGPRHAANNPAFNGHQDPKTTI